MSPDARSAPAEARRGGVPWKKIGIALALAAGATALLAAGGRLGAYVPAFREWVQGFGLWAPVVFILGYALAAVAFVPGASLTAASGATFGVVQGTLYAWLGATLGSGGAFLIARYAARSWVEGKLAGNPRLAAVDRAVEREGGKVVALLRLSPAFPFNLLNYALGLTKVGFVAYLAAGLAMVPGTLLYAYYGKVLGDVVAATGGGVRKGPLEWTLLGVGLAATVAVTVLITRRARQALADRVDPDRDDGRGPEEEPHHA